jgi:hypothetical protein
MKAKDWFPSSRAGQNVLFNNFKAKIGNYQTTFNLSEEQLRKLQTICDIFLEVYQKVEQNRAAMANLTAWQDAIFNGRPQGDPVPATPTFVDITLPANSFIGIFAEFRELVGFLKNHPNYTENIGLDLKIVAENNEGENLNEVSPELKLTVKNDNSIEVTFKKSDFDALELQYRKSGVEIWQLADKSTSSPVNHQPALSTAGQSEKFEYRGIYLLKNQRVGTWSPIYLVTAG